MKADNTWLLRMLVLTLTWLALEPGLWLPQPGARAYAKGMSLLAQDYAGALVQFDAALAAEPRTASCRCIAGRAACTSSSGMPNRWPRTRVS